MDDLYWTPKMVAVYLEEAADTLRRLPPVKVQGYASTWPPMVREYWDAYGWEEAAVRLGPPTTKAIDQMDETLVWLRWLDLNDSRLVWRRACGRPWKAITHEFGVDRTTAWRHWTSALVTMSTKLNSLKRQEKSCNTRATSRNATNMARNGRVCP
ncbi:hypothetical protein H261_05514 [Paramagnetospirillum caucaseum]|uniref:DUF6362 domain-containing protein n=1 Tax=Paramagnetospirillum caucaseum TaxID=1244869 RepID=M3ADY8_9PROT|nr:DUF6362 family protein [Paramagnetospirillum caucaseum]EME71018.1 hypothetical protein H261_05514 [Paramagnetospirillum caucaseum]